MNSKNIKNFKIYNQKPKLILEEYELLEKIKEKLKFTEKQAALIISSF
jgi:hypothetical protein